MTGRDDDERVLMRLRRLGAAAEAMTEHDDRRRLLALESDLKLIREQLQDQCRRLSDQIKAASARTNAVTAYARCASLRTEPSGARPSSKPWSD
jgi:hypothetical protein